MMSPNSIDRAFRQYAPRSHDPKPEKVLRFTVLTRDLRNPSQEEPAVERTLSTRGGIAMNPLMGLGLLVLALVASWTPGAFAQASDYPNRPVTLVVPLAPGGGNDILARLVAQKLERKFGKPFVVENQPQGGDIPAALRVVRAPPDG